MTLFAKSADEAGIRETLLDHSIRVIEMIRRLYSRLPAHVLGDPDLIRDLELAAAVHDVGKSATGFQDMVLERARDWKRRRHEILSAAFAANLPVSEEVIFAVMTHHKCIPDFPPIENAGRLRFHPNGPEDWDNTLSDFEGNRVAFRELWTAIATYLGRSELQAAADAPLDPAFIRRAWCRPDRQRREIESGTRLRASLIRGLLISADHLASGNVNPPQPVDLKVFQPSFTLRPFQQAARVKANVILRAPTGSGKTEAALSWAAENQPENGRLFYTLPYTAALNSMHRRLLKEFPAQKEAIGLLHGRAVHHLYETMQEDFPADPYGAQSEALARAHLAREMYHTLRVCTPHQLLRYTLRGKGWEQILSEIPGACIVFDEVHSYDPALAGLTLGTARLLHNLGAKLMFVSATLPSFLERIISELVPCERIEPDPLKSEDREITDRLRHQVRIEDSSVLDLVPRIIDDVNTHLKVLVVCNHVRSAQSVARSLRERLGNRAVSLFHGRFNMKDRTLIEQSLSPGSLPSVLVATQVVEVSLDVSFDRGYFEAAPIDALAQRMGRVNRRGQFPPAPVVIASRPLNRRHQIYDPTRTESTLRLLGHLEAPISERDLVRICDEVYSGGYTGNDLTDFQERLEHPYFIRFADTLVAGDHENWVDQVIEVEGRMDVLPANLRPEFDAKMAQRLWLDADRLTVNIRASQAVVEEYVDRSDDPWLIRLDYGEDGLALPA